MEKRDELEKEERTIFIVLAIIVLIAIGVLLTWYFTKDKKAEDKDSDTKTKTIETKKKKEEETEEDENVSYTVTTKEESNTPVVVLSSNVKANNEEVKIVDTAEVVETPATPIVPVEPVEEIVVHDSSKPYYFVGEKIKLSGNITNVTDTDAQSVDGKYSIENGVISFTENGIYYVTIDGQEEPIILMIFDDKEDLLVKMVFVDLLLEMREHYLNPELLSEYKQASSTLFENGKNATYNELRDYVKNFQIAYDNVSGTFNEAQYTVDRIIKGKISSIQEILKENATITQEYENITIDILNNEANIGSVIGVAGSIINALQENKDTIDFVSCGNAKLTISDNLDVGELTNFVKKILGALGIDDPSTQTTLGSLIGKKVDISVKLKDNDTEAKYYMSFTGTASASASVDEANITSISNDDIVLVDTATAQAVVETDVKNEETDEKVISNDIISEEEPGEEVTEPSTFVKEEEDGTGLVKEDQIQESQALDPNLEVKETTLN